MISESEILDELRRALEPQDADGFTSLDVANALGIQQHRAQEHIRRLARRGKIALAGSRAGIRVDGRPCQSPVYRLVA